MSILKEIGALQEEDQCTFTVWAPFAKKVELSITAPESRQFDMEQKEYGYWKAVIENIRPGTRYKYSIDGKDPRPDPASRFQPDGVHDSSEVVDIKDHQWNDQDWKNPPFSDYIIYELHTGTFSETADFTGIIEKLDHLSGLGINAIELFPVAQFPGKRNWGYDGVYPFAVQNSYGGPHELMKLVDACHNKGMAVIMDVVYNHLGPEGNYLNYFGPYFSDRYATPWGQAVNFDDRYCDGWRNFVVQNALMWLKDYHIDALRLDAVHAIYDFSAKHIMQELTEETEKLNRETGKQHYLIAESDLNDSRYITPIDKGGYGLDAQWSDDLHHSLHALITGERMGYYKDFGTIDHLAKAFSSAFVYDGKYSEFRKRTFGNSPELNEARQFVVSMQNHDQTGNRKFGERLTALTDDEMIKVIAAVMITSPFVPMLFMGEEYGEKNPFLYFVNHNDQELNRLVREGRNREFKDFYGDSREKVPDPADEETFNRSKLSWDVESEREKTILNYYRELLRLRKTLPALKAPDKKNIRVKTQENMLIAERAEEMDVILCIFNFENNYKEILIDPAHASTLYTILDSSDRKWRGPGSLINPVVKKGEKIVVNQRSFVLFSNQKI